MTLTTSRRDIIGGAFGFASALALAACARRDGGGQDGVARLPLTAPLPDQIPPGVELSIGDPTVQHALDYAGLAKDLPFKVKWAQITGGPGVTEAFNARALDVGLGVSVPAVHAQWSGIPIKIIGVSQRKDPLKHPTYVLGVSPKAQVHSLADLRGKKIAFSRSQIQAMVVLESLKAAGLSTRDVTLVDLPSSIGGDVYTNALASNAVDVAPIGAGIIAQRYLANFGRDGARVIAHPPFRDDIITIYVRTETLEDPAKAAALKAFLPYWARAEAWMQTHRAEWAQKYYVENQGLTPRDAGIILDAASETDIPKSWDDAIALVQTTIDLLGPETGRPHFDAASLFDRRFEPLGGDAFAGALQEQKT